MRLLMYVQAYLAQRKLPLLVTNSGLIYFVKISEYFHTVIFYSILITEDHQTIFS